MLSPSQRRRYAGRRVAWRRGLVREDQDRTTRAPGRDEGFSVVEVVVAIAIFALIASFMSQLLASGLKGVLLGKRREIATQEANRVLEIARSLTFDAIGLVQTDPTIPTDAAIADQGGQLSYQSDGIWEPIIWATNPTDHPFDPHVESVTRASTHLTRYIYITAVDGATDLKRLSVRVTWDEGGSGGPVNEVRAQTLVNESGLLPTGPGAGGGTTSGLTPLTASTLATPGNLEISSSLLGLTNPLSITLPSTSGTTAFRAVSDTNCTAKSTSIQATDLVDLEGPGVTVTADDDARTATPSDPPLQSNPGTLSVPLGAVRNLIGSVVSSPISCDATTTPLPQEEGSASTGTVTAATTVLGLGVLGNTLLTPATLQTAPSTQEIEHTTPSGSRHVTATANNSLSGIQVLKLGTTIPNGLVELTSLDYGASVQGAEGTPASAPSITAPAFTVRVFDNGSKLGAGCTTGITPGPGISASKSGSYCVYTVTPTTSGFTGVSIPVTHNFTQGIPLLNLVSLSYSLTVDILSPTMSGIAGDVGANGEKRWTAEYRPLAISANLNASVLGIELINADVDLNLGTVRAEACAGATCL